MGHSWQSSAERLGAFTVLWISFPSCQSRHHRLKTRAKSPCLSVHPCSMTYHRAQGARCSPWVQDEGQGTDITSLTPVLLECGAHPASLCP